MTRSSLGTRRASPISKWPVVDSRPPLIWKAGCTGCTETFSFYINPSLEAMPASGHRFWFTYFREQAGKQQFCRLASTMLTHGSEHHLAVCSVTARNNFKFRTAIRALKEHGKPRTHYVEQNDTRTFIRELLNQPQAFNILPKSLRYGAAGAAPEQRPSLDFTSGRHLGVPGTKPHFWLLAQWGICLRFSLSLCSSLCPLSPSLKYLNLWGEKSLV